MDIKQKFEAMCQFIIKGEEGFFFPFESVEYDKEFSKISASEDYDSLKVKMNNFIELINNDNSLVEKDITTELWYLV